MEQFENAITEILGLIWEMISAIGSAIPAVLKFLVWVLLAIIVLPCVFVAGHIYPWWVEFGEDF